MMSAMPISLFREWRAFYNMEPFGEERADWRAASINSMLFNINRNKGATTRPAKDFLLEFRTAKERSAPKQDWRWMKALGASIAGKEWPAD